MMEMAAQIAFWAMLGAAAWSIMAVITAFKFGVDADGRNRTVQRVMIDHITYRAFIVGMFATGGSFIAWMILLAIR